MPSPSPLVAEASTPPLIVAPKAFVTLAVTEVFTPSTLRPEPFKAWIVPALLFTVSEEGPILAPSVAMP